MCKVLLVVDIPVVAIGLSDIVKRKIKDAEVEVARSFEEMDINTCGNRYELVLFCLPIHKNGQMAALLDLIEKSPSMAVIIITENLDIPLLQGLFRAGIQGMLIWSATEEEIHTAITQVHKGNLYVNQQFLRMLFALDNKKPSLWRDLTLRETIVAKLLMEGKTNMQICQMLVLKPSTVSTFKTKIYSKLQVTNVMELEKAKMGDRQGNSKF